MLCKYIIYLIYKSFLNLLCTGNLIPRSICPLFDTKANILRSGIGSLLQSKLNRALPR